MKVNIKTVAEKAGVSTATVSRVLTGYPNVKKQTREKILKVIAELNYEVNAVARSLRQKKTNSIGIIVGNILSEFYSIIAKSVEDVASSYGYNLILCNSDFNPDKELNYLKVLKSNRVDGIILYPTGGNKEYVGSLIATGTKIVLLDGLIEGLKCDAVLADNEKGAFDAINFLLEQGYRNIGIISGDTTKTTGKDRLNGCKRALKGKGLSPNENLIKIGSFKKVSGIELARDLLETKNQVKPDALFVGNLDMTMGAIITIKEKGLRIPEDIGVIGYDDSDWARLLEPPLTTVSQPVYDLGAAACKMLIEKIESNSDIKLKNEPIIKVFKTKLIIRNSTKLLKSL